MKEELCMDRTLKTEGLGGDKIPALSTFFTFPLGAAVSRSSLEPGEPQHELLKHFNIYVAENDMKPECLEPDSDSFDFTYADKLMDYAEANGKKVRGHVLVWHNQTPDWFFRGSGDGGLAIREELYARMENHIKKVLTHYKGRIDSWDVANEVLADDGKPRNSKYYQITGSYDYILRAFTWARESDPDARLFLTDYNVEYPGDKQDGFYKLASWLTEQGAPIDGVGFQSHISVHWPGVKDIGNAIERFSALGLKVQITELDMSFFTHNDRTAVKNSVEIEKLLRDQACKYRDLFMLFREKALDGKLDMVLVWGLSDGGSWLNDFPVTGRTNYPLLFDRDCRPKQAFWALAMLHGFYNGVFMKAAGLKNILRGIFCLVFVLGILSCNFSFGGNDKGDVQIRYNDLRQPIDGFGGSNAWTGLPSGAASREVVKLLYSKTEGAGFTILRNRIPFRERLSGDENPGYNDGFITRKADDTYQYIEEGGVKTFSLNWGSWDLGNTKNLIQAIKALGGNGPETLTLMSTPWTPPNNRVTNWKLNVPDKSKPDVGGRLAPERYEDYADLLADYAKGFESNMGVPLAVLSVQNEPHWEPDYESCKWTGEEIRDFLIVLGRRFVLKNVGATLGIMAPEDENFREDFITASLNDAAAKEVLTHVGLHQYEGASDSSGYAGAEGLPNVSVAGKRIWQTEVSGSGPVMPAGNGMDNALYYARMIHLDMTLAETNAFLFWWLWTNGGADPAGSLISVNNGAVNPAMRLFAMGQYSRFVRPGWLRIGSTTSPAAGVYSKRLPPSLIGENRRGTDQ